MVPRIDLTAVDADEALAELDGCRVQEGGSEVPIYERRCDRIMRMVQRGTLSKPLLPQRRGGAGNPGDCQCATRISSEGTTSS